MAEDSPALEAVKEELQKWVAEVQASAKLVEECRHNLRRFVRAQEQAEAQRCKLQRAINVLDGSDDGPEPEPEEEHDA